MGTSGWRRGEWPVLNLIIICFKEQYIGMFIVLSANTLLKTEMYFMLIFKPSQIRSTFFFNNSNTDFIPMFRQYHTLF